MKIFRVLWVIGFALVITGQSILFAQEDNKGDENLQKILEMVEKKELTIDVNRAIPMSGPLVNLTTPYSLKIADDVIVSSLPYYGRAHSLPYGGGVGLNFEGVITDFSYARNKKGTFTIEFKTKSEDDYLKFRILVHSNKTALIYVQPGRRQSISFQGNLRWKD